MPKYKAIYRETEDGRRLARIRSDLLKDEQGVPIGLEIESEYYTSAEPLEYRWRNNDEIFEVLHNGQWKEAYSIDFDFCW